MCGCIPSMIRPGGSTSISATTLSITHCRRGWVFFSDRSYLEPGSLYFTGSVDVRTVFHVAKTAPANNELAGGGVDVGAPSVGHQDDAQSGACQQRPPTPNCVAATACQCNSCERGAALTVPVAPKYTSLLR